MTACSASGKYGGVKAAINGHSGGLHANRAGGCRLGALTRPSTAGADGQTPYEGRNEELTVQERTGTRQGAVL
jgi:hypothetical protein